MTGRKNFSGRSANLLEERNDMDKIDTPALRAQYSPDGSTLRNAQLRMLDILKVVDEICRRHNLGYWLTCATLLGAVRHGGFVPWDDDLDIAMMRDDYLKLMEILPRELPDNLELQNDVTEPGYVYMYCKVRDRNSNIRETCDVNKKFRDQGLFIDIFPMEESSFALCKIAAPLFNRMVFDVALRKGTDCGLYKFNRKFLLGFLFPVFRALSVFAPKGRIHHTFGVNFLQEKTREMIFPLGKVTFEGIEFCAPKDPDAYLTKHFGDYMSLPKNIQPVHAEEIKIW